MSSHRVDADSAAGWHMGSPPLPPCPAAAACLSWAPSRQRIRASASFLSQILFLPISLPVQELLLVPGRMEIHLSQNRQLLSPALHALLLLPTPQPPTAQEIHAVIQMP